MGKAGCPIQRSDILDFVGLDGPFITASQNEAVVGDFIDSPYAQVTKAAKQLS